LFTESGKYEEGTTKDALLPYNDSENLENKIEVRLSGRSDLRIETPEFNIIVDFKTGQYNNNQLYFYIYLYYGINNDKKILLTFWDIKDMEATKSKIDEKEYYKDMEKAITWRNNIYDTLNKCVTEGYKLGKNVSQLNQMKRITRADLYHPNQGGNNE